MAAPSSRAARLMIQVRATLRALGRAEARITVMSAEGLAQIRAGRQFIQLGYAGFGDFCREELGLNPRASQRRVALAQVLARWPDLQGAFLAGELSACQALAVAPLVTGESAPSWAVVAGGMTVRELQRLVRRRREEERAANVVASEDSEPAADEPGRRISFQAPPAAHVAFEQAMEQARRQLGWQAPRHECVEALLIEASPEALGEVVEEERVRQQPCDRPSGPPCGAAPLFVDRARESRLREAMARAAEAVQEVEEFAAPVAGGSPDERLRALRQLEQRHRPLRLITAEFVRAVQAWGGLDGVMAELGCSERTARELVAEANTFEDDESLAGAFERGQIDLGQAAAIRRVMTTATRAAWIRRAGQVTVRQFQREVRLVERLAELRTVLGISMMSPLPRAGLEEALRAGLRRSGYTERDIQRAVRPWRGARGASPGVDPAADHCAMKRLEVLAERLLLEVYPDGVRQTLSRDEARRWISFWAPEPVARHWRAALDGVRRRMEEPSLPDWAGAILLINRAFEVWRTGEKPAHHRILERDDYACRAPGCSNRRHLEVHHIVFRSHGGSDRPENLITLCATHHREVVHGGYLSVRQEVGRVCWATGPGRARYHPTK